ncbi:ribosomal protein S21e [Tribonema minus]|uniref:40S ribosomal protein S21 n=1 Tax=Tribonema minus TaxID=303371 RepID=A0A835Z072_9STRA|nr:ribosomal protein S21e [Tribonema minus]
MQNESGKDVDLYVPRKCSWTNRLLVAKDHASVQINVAKIDPQTGVATGAHEVFALAGFLRRLGQSDNALAALSSQKDAEAQIAV